MRATEKRGEGEKIYHNSFLDNAVKLSGDKAHEGLNQGTPYSFYLDNKNL